MIFENIPHEMRLFKQWVVWRYEDTESFKPTKVPYSAKFGTLAKTNDPQTWSSFDEALHALTSSNWYSGIGFVLTEYDPYTFIDLDDPYELNSDGSYKHENPQEILSRQLEVYNSTNSYAECSPSGKGLHIICRGAVPSGRKRSSLEVYSDGRYMTMTGNVYRKTDILDCNDFVNILWERLGAGKKAELFYAGLESAKLTDEKLLEIASTAANGEKFNKLYYEGFWQGMYTSQSEADFALIDIIAYYSENSQQTQRIFLNSVLGQREKSRAQYRINYMLGRCFDRMLPPVDIEGLRNQVDEAISKSKARAEKPLSHQVQQKATELQPIAELDNTFSVPPGLVGELAKFIYAAAPRPVPEIALAGALGLIAGIVGRAYNVSGTGLNQYVLLLAPTGTGKEAIAGGVDKLMSAVIRTVPAANEFIGPGKISSEQAMIKYMAKTSNCFVSIVGEFGIQLKLMASPNAAPHMQGLLSMFLDLYNKSGEGKILRPSIYSDREKNTISVQAPSFTLIGESTPEKFYEALDESMISSGLLPRFTIVQYDGKRVGRNDHHMHAQPSFDVVEKLSTICAHSLMLNSQHKAIHVQFTDESKKLFDAFDLHCDLNINTSDREIRRHLWNRAHIKSMKLAALIAVGCNPYDPTIDATIANWSIKFITADVRNLLARFDAGEIGIDNDETKQLAKTISTIKEYVISPFSEVHKYVGDGFSKLHSDRIIPYSYIQRRLAAVSVFKKDRIGSSAALKRSIKTLIERGDIQEVSRSVLTKEYQSTAMSYAISNLKAFGF